MSQATERAANALLLRRLARGGAPLDGAAASAALLKRGQGRTVLVVGGGGREHAIAWKLAQSADVSRVLVCPGNGGTAALGGKVATVAVANLASVGEVAGFAVAEGVDLVVVGPEQPLVEGLADALAEACVPCFGPTRGAAQIEASKAWAKDFMGRHNIPTSKHATFARDQLAAAEQYVRTCGFPVVVKASGLAAGKGVLMPEGLDATLAALREVMVDDAFGAAGDEVVLEERMEGPEASMLAFCDGRSVRMMPAAQDHKRVGDGDTGLNTGGMGAYAPAPLVTPAIAARVLKEVLEPAVRGLAAEGRPFVGVLYAGMMMTPRDGPRVVEFNCRFGDPETQVLLPLLDTDLLHVMESCALGELASMGALAWKPAHAVTVVAASPGYPVKYPQGRQIYGLEDVPRAGGAVGSGDDVMVFHAGTRLREGDKSVVETSGGRVLVVTSLSTKSLRLAASGAYAGLRALDFEGMQYRYDIAARALTGERPLRVAVLGSTRGTDLGSLLDALALGRAAGVSIDVVVSNRKGSEILGRAEAAGIPAIHVPCPKGTARETYDQAVTSVLDEHGPIDVVLMIGYMRIVSPSFTARWANKLVREGRGGGGRRWLSSPCRWGFCCCCCYILEISN
jgi:phosphoribosylamine--glycine ligase